MKLCRTSATATAASRSSCAAAGCRSTTCRIDCAGVTIGVNDIGRRFDPTYLVVLNPRSQFSGERFRYVETSRAQALFSQLDLGIRHPRVVRLRLGQRGGTELGPGDALPYTRNSPYVALFLRAVHGRAPHRPHRGRLHQ
ncbi:MAG: hypothetical protein MZW92_40690 [Comamonadaceae bacterium]|nr:hypothetical protein [Comamonadaceae bacterium]